MTQTSTSAEQLGLKTKPRNLYCLVKVVYARVMHQYSSCYASKYYLTTCFHRFGSNFGYRLLFNVWYKG